MTQNTIIVTTRQTIYKKIGLILLVIFALYLLTDHEKTNNNNDNASNKQRHFAVITALHRHAPCLRVYRSLLEFNLCVFCMAFALYFWKRTIGNSIIGLLLFQPAPPFCRAVNPICKRKNNDNNDDDDDDGVNQSRIYHPIQNNDDYEEEEDDKKGNDDNYNHIDREIEMQIANATIQNDNNENDDRLYTVHTKDENNQKYGHDNSHDNEEEEEEEEDMLLIIDESPIHHDYEAFPPNAIDVLSKALDMLLFILVSLFFFTLISAEGGAYIDGDHTFFQQQYTVFENMAMITAPIVPLVLFILFALYSIFPWKNSREYIWSIISITVHAPFQPVTFRDGFVGDILTSTVRPLQDVVYTLFYIGCGLQGWWITTSKSLIDNDNADMMDTTIPSSLETNWWLHTWLLPMCMVSPLWWRFCQTLKQTYDTKQRWPYLGNAFKYFIAAQVAMFGVFDPQRKENVAWILSFVIATLYQIWWDIYMDWELLQHHHHHDHHDNYFSKTTFHLRPIRIYSSSTLFYWCILFGNVILRFGWTISLIPPKYLTQAGMLKYTFHDDFSTIIGPAIASAEIIRRTFWGFLRIELEAIKTVQRDIKNNNNEIMNNNNSKWQDLPWYKQVVENHHQQQQQQQQQQQKSLDNEAISMTPMETKITESESSRHHHHYLGWMSTEMSMLTDLQILVELSLYGIIFTALGMFAAHHHLTMPFY